MTRWALGLFICAACITPPRDGHVWGVTENVSKRLDRNTQLVCDWEPQTKLLDCETMDEYVERKRWELLTGERIPKRR